MKNWYIVQTFSGFEQKVVETLKEVYRYMEAPDLQFLCMKSLK